MRYLGVDYGKKRIGLALSDERGIIALPYAVLANDGSAGGTLASVARIVKKEKVGKAVVGLPRSFGGGLSLQAKETDEFARKLAQELNLPVELENEMLTTKIARRSTPRQKVDASAAALILQSYLDRHCAK